MSVCVNYFMAQQEFSTKNLKKLQKSLEYAL